MNREIKFRVWSTIDSDAPKMIDLNPKNKRFSSKDLVNDSDWHLMQFTGLKDKNGVEVYEGDVVDCHHYKLIYTTVPIEDASSTKGIVEYKPGSFVVKRLSLAAFGKIEVIGNIYENSELLNEKNTNL